MVDTHMTELCVGPRTALLSLDLQTGIVSTYVKEGDPLLTNAQAVLARARSAGLLIVHVRVGFRPGCPEISARNLLFGSIKASPQHQKLFSGSAGAFHWALAPQDGEIIVTKSRVSAFAGTDLDLILRANDISTVALFGIATSGVVLSTLLDASDRDYETIVIADCCTDADQELHRCLVDRLFPRRARIISAQDFVRALTTGEPAP